jgi:hypothetical protein
MEKKRYWRTVLPAYLKISFSYFVAFSAAPLAIVLVSTLWVGLRTGRWTINRVGVELALIFGGFFFVLALATAIGDDVQRNWKTTERTLAWHPQLMWKTFLYLGAVGFLVAAFLAYHQGVWLTVEFLAFSVFSAIVAKKCFSAQPNP